MKVVFKISALLLILVWGSVNGYSQTSGFLGKRFILNSELFSSLFDKGYDGGAEYVLSRNLSFYTDYHFRNKNYRQKLLPYYSRYGKYPDERANFKSKNLSFGLKIYQNQAFTAPKGMYLFFQYAYGRADIEGNYFVLNDEFDADSDEYYLYKIKNARSRIIDYGFGVQNILWKFVVVDFKFGITSAKLNVEQKNEYLIDEVAYKYGPNFINWGGTLGRKTGGLGLSARFKVGFLLF